MKLPESLLFALAAAQLVGCSRQAPQPTARNDIAAPAVKACVYAKGRIDIEGGLIRLAASREGLVKQVSVEEGEHVLAGQTLAIIDDRPARLALAVAQAELAQASAALPTLRVRLAAANRETARIESLLLAKVSTQADFDLARDQSNLIAAELAASEASIATAQARLNASEYEVAQHIVRAPLEGWIVQRHARPGDGVSTLNVTPLFLFAPDSPRIVRADLDERFVDQIHEGLSAEVILEADETRIIPGKVLRLGQVFGVKAPTGEPRERIDQRVIECVVSVTDQSLRIGQRVLVRITP